MPVIKNSDDIAANASVNVLVGSIFEFLPWNASINLGVTADATGLLYTFTSGSDVVIEESPVDVKAGLFPVIPDDMDVQDVAGMSERMVLQIRNTTGAAITARTLLQLMPLQ